jgi:hypothetical protein
MRGGAGGGASGAWGVTSGTGAGEVTSGAGEVSSGGGRVTSGCADPRWLKGFAVALVREIVDLGVEINARAPLP